MIRHAAQLPFNFNRETGLTFDYICIIKGRQEMRTALAAKLLRCQKAVIETIANQFNLDYIAAKIWVFWIFCCGVVTGIKIVPCTPKWRHM